MVDHVIDRRTARVPDLSPSVISLAVDVARQTTRDAKITDYLPILLERDAAERLIRAHEPIKAEPPARGARTTEPPTRCPMVCTPPPGVNGASRPCGMPFGHR